MQFHLGISIVKYDTKREIEALFHLKTRIFCLLAYEETSPMALALSSRRVTLGLQAKRSL